MRLLGTRTEREIRDNFNKYSPLIMEDSDVASFLKDKFKIINSVYALNHTIEQCEDIYTLLVNGEVIIDFEVSRIDHSIYDVSVKKVSDYSKEIKRKIPKLKLMIALELSKEIK